MVERRCRVELVSAPRSVEATKKAVKATKNEDFRIARQPQIESERVPVIGGEQVRRYIAQACSRVPRLRQNIFNGGCPACVSDKTHGRKQSEVETKS